MSEEYSQIWQLTKMTGSISNSETTKGNMDWQEFYVLNSDGTFVKSDTANILNRIKKNVLNFLNKEN